MKRMLVALAMLLCLLPCFAMSASAEETDLDTLIAQLPEVSDPMGTEYYFYNQLSDIEKVIYWKITEATWENPKIIITGVNGLTIDEVCTSASNALYALFADDPEYSMRWDTSCFTTLYVETDSVVINLVQLQGSSEYLIQKAEARIQQIVETVGLEGDLYSRTRDLMELISKNDYTDFYMPGDKPISGSLKYYYNESAFGYLVFGKAGYKGYSDAFKILCDELNIPCIIVSTVENDGLVRWNFIRLDDDLWYSVDPSWNPISIYGSQSTEYLNNTSYRASELCLCAANMGYFQFPVLANNAYTYSGIYVPGYHEAEHHFEEPEPTFVYRVNEDQVTCTITAYQGRQEGDLIIPDTIDGFLVTGIDQHAFYSCNGFTGDIVIPDTVTRIGFGAFRQCKNIAGVVVLPEHLEEIGYYAFLGNEKMTGTLSFPDTLKSIGDCAFYWCKSLTGDITLPTGIELGSQIFNYCTSLCGTLYLPDSFVWNGNIISGTGISRIEVNDTNTCYATYDGMLFSKDMKTFLACPGGKGGILNLPEGVEIISDLACYNNTNLSGTLCLPNSIKEIGDFAFCGTNFSGNLIIPDSTEIIGQYAFYEATDFTETGVPGELVLPNGITRIGERAFRNNGFTGTLRIPESIEYVGPDAFRENQFSDIVIASSAAFFDERAFANTGCCRLIIEGDHNQFGAMAFADCPYMKMVEFRGSSSELAEDCFSGLSVPVYYPFDNTDWVDFAFENYGGEVTWLPCCNGVEHSHIEVYITPPTCTEKGYSQYVCSCGDSYIGNYVEANGHYFYYETIIKEATEHENGEKLLECCYCDETKTEIIPAHKHNFSNGKCKTCGMTDPNYVPEGPEADCPIYDGGNHQYIVSAVISPTCTEKGYTIYACPCGDIYYGNYRDAWGHTVDTNSDGFTVIKYPSCVEDGMSSEVYCSVCKQYVNLVYPAFGHDYVNGTCSRCGEEDPDYEEPTDPVAPEDPALDGVIRIAGDDRIATSLMLADQLKEVLGVEKFDAVVVASALNFPDALTGSYLAAEKNAPILLTYPAAHAKIRAYIQENLKPGGMVYILGGEGAISADFADGLSNFTVKRLAGSDRFGTNLAIMEEAGVSADQPVLIATATNFADSLSASAAGLPMVLVYGSLRPDQKEFLATTSKNFIIIGGEAAVSKSLENELAAIGSVTRLAGSSRFETSVLVAERFVQNPDAVILAYARNFPDGLCGGPLAYALGAPLILTDNAGHSAADAYVSGISAGIVVGGTGLISDETVALIFDK